MADQLEFSMTTAVVASAACEAGAAQATVSIAAVSQRGTSDVPRGLRREFPALQRPGSRETDDDVCWDIMAMYTGTARILPQGNRIF